MNSEVSEYYTPEEASKILVVHLNTIYNWLRKGELKGFKIGGIWRIRKEDLPKG
ncbi:MAG: helix-turn-helix domain-containing protein [Thermoplasmata archaeon]|nr:helix-turn-helix domain-containing protein [Thermoplasmata archaeon]